MNAEISDAQRCAKPPSLMPFHAHRASRMARVGGPGHQRSLLMHELVHQVGWILTSLCIAAFGLSACEIGEIDSEPEAEAELVCLEREDGTPTCALRVPGTDTWVTHLTRPCDPAPPEVERLVFSGAGFDGWAVQAPVPALQLEPADAWPEETGWFFCGGEIELGDWLENPRCGRACEGCVVRCAAELDGHPVMIAPTCNLSRFDAEPEDFAPTCGGFA